MTYFRLGIERYVVGAGSNALRSMVPAYVHPKGQRWSYRDTMHNTTNIELDDLFQWTGHLSPMTVVCTLVARQREICKKSSGRYSAMSRCWPKYSTTFGIICHRPRKVKLRKCTKRFWKEQHTIWRKYTLTEDRKEQVNGREIANHNQKSLVGKIVPTVAVKVSNYNSPWRILPN